jgi:hypothetical protein
LVIARHEPVINSRFADEPVNPSLSRAITK